MPSNAPKMNKCHFCNLIFKSIFELREHYKEIHTTEKNFRGPKAEMRRAFTLLA